MGRTILERFLYKLNTPWSVLAVLVVVFLVNGFLFYRLQMAPPVASRPLPQAPSPEGEASPEAYGSEEAPPETPASAPSAGRTIAGASGGTRSTYAAAGEAGSEGPSEPTGNGGAVERPPRGSDPAVDLGALDEAVRGCRAEVEACVAEFVLRVSPGAEYVGGRQDLAAPGTEGGREVLYFETPDLKPCRSVREAYEVQGGPTYDVIVVGEGSFESSGGAECVPEA